LTLLSGIDLEGMLALLLEGMPPKREVEHIQLLLDSPFPNVVLYKKYILEVDEVKK